MEYLKIHEMKVSLGNNKIVPLCHRSLIKPATVSCSIFLNHCAGVQSLSASNYFPDGTVSVIVSGGVYDILGSVTDPFSLLLIFAAPPEACLSDGRCRR